MLTNLTNGTSEADIIILTYIYVNGIARLKNISFSEIIAEVSFNKIDFVQISIKLLCIEHSFSGNSNTTYTEYSELNKKENATTN